MTDVIAQIPEDKYQIGLNPEGNYERFPQVWENKISGQLFVVAPWWDIMQSDVILNADLSDFDEKLKIVKDERKVVMGALAQVGWLIENGNGVFFGIGMAAQESFEKISEL